MSQTSDDGRSSSHVVPVSATALDLGNYFSGERLTALIRFFIAQGGSGLLDHEVGAFDYPGRGFGSTDVFTWNAAWNGGTDIVTQLVLNPTKLAEDMGSDISDFAAHVHMQTYRVEGHSVPGTSLSSDSDLAFASRSNTGNPYYMLSRGGVQVSTPDGRCIQLAGTNWWIK